MRRPKLLIAVVLGTVAVAGLAARVWIAQKEVTEYGGQCGRFRTCRVDGLGLTRRCTATPGWNTAWAITPFAPEADCGDDWVPVVTQIGPPGKRRMGKTDSAEGGLILQVARLASPLTGEEKATHVRHLAALWWDHFGMTTPYRVGACGVYASDLDADSPRIVIVGNLDTDADLDCWVRFEDGTIRHVQRD